VKNLQQQTGARIIVEKYAQGPEQPIIIMGEFSEERMSLFHNVYIVRNL
jgi:hypothetical protein